MPDQNDLTTLAALKLRLGATTSTDDTALSALITAASYDFLERCNRASLASNTYTETYDGQGGQRQLLLNYPVTAVASLTIGTVTVPASPGPGLPGFVFDRFGLKLIGYEFCQGFQNISVTYTAGFAAVPPEVAQAVNTMCAAWWRRQQWTDQASKNIAGDTVQFRREDIPPEAARVVEQYTRRVSI